jgi:hypothetical protein
MLNTSTLRCKWHKENERIEISDDGQPKRGESKPEQKKTATKDQSECAMIAPDETLTTEFFYRESKFTEGFGSEDNDGNPGIIYPVVDYIKIITSGTLSGERYG